MRKHRQIATLLPILMLFVSVSSGQKTGRLSQKLLLENTVQQRVTSAMTKVLDESQFVVDVKVELAYGSGTDASRNANGMPSSRTFDSTGPTSDIDGSRSPGEAMPTTDNTAVRPRSANNPFPIPGFPDVDALRGNEPVRVLDDSGNPAANETNDDPGENNLADDFTFSDDAFDAGEIDGLPQIRSMSLKIILADGVSPQTIENVRQVALVASRFDRDRGDVLSITTASFKDRPFGSRFADRFEGDSRDLAGAQNKASAENEELKETLREAEARNEQLMQDIRDREMEYLQQSEEERKKALSDLASVQNERAKDLIFLQQQREESNSKLQDALLNQISELRSETRSELLSQREQDIKTAQATSLEDSLAAFKRAFEEEKRQLQEQIEAALNPTPIQPQGLGGLLGGQGLAIMGMMLFLAMLAVIVIMAMRSRAPSPAMGYAPPYPQRPRKRRPKKKAPEEAAPAPVAATPEPPVPAPPPPAPVAEPAEWKPEAPAESQEVLQAELKSIRQSVVSMSVGRQDTAARILGDWLGEDQGGQSGPEPEPSAEDQESTDEPSNGEES